MEWWEIVLRLVLAVVLSGIIGFERELHGRPAGLRTHILVCVGAALVMLISIDGFGGSGDPARLAAQVVSGIGFLGAGAILRDGGDIKGITTAATLWIVGMIGLACGNGYYIGAIVATAICVILILILRPVERKINNRSHKLTIVYDDKTPALAKIVEIFDREEITISNLDVESIVFEGKKALRLHINLYKTTRIEVLNKLLLEITEEIKPYSISTR